MPTNLITLLDEYLHSRKTDPNHSDTSFEKQLQRMRKPESEIHDTMIELADEWHKELANMDNLKISYRNIVLGSIIGFGTFFVQIITALGFFGKQSPFMAYGLLAIGFGLLIQGVTVRRRVKLTRKRRENKWKKW